MGGVKTPRQTRVLPVSAGARALFLAELAQSANVTKAAKVADVMSVAIYKLRQRDAAFRQAWQAALCEGYARLEAALLAEALAPAAGRAANTTLKERQQKQRLGLALLAAHRLSVRAEQALSQGKARVGGSAAAPGAGTAANQLRTKLDQMDANLASAPDEDAD
jgi:hypothetical protein